MNKKISIGIMFMLVSMSFAIASVNANPNIQLQVEGSFEGQAHVPMYWDLHVIDGTPPYRYGGSYGDGPHAWATLPIYDNPYTISYTYTEEGEYNWMACVKDADGDRAEVRRVVTIGPPPLMVEIVRPMAAMLWVDVPYQWDCNVIGGEEPYTYDWDMGDGTHYNIKNPVHAWETPGEYTVHLDVWDLGKNNDHAWDEEAITVYGYDLSVTVWSRLPFAFAGSWILFKITAWWNWNNGLSNADCDSYYMEYEWVWDKTGEPLAWGTIPGDGNGLGYRDRTDVHDKWIQAPYVPLSTCTLSVTIYSDYDYDDSDNVGHKTILIIF